MTHQGVTLLFLLLLFFFILSLWVCLCVILIFIVIVVTGCLLCLESNSNGKESHQWQDLFRKEVSIKCDLSLRFLNLHYNCNQALERNAYKRNSSIIYRALPAFFCIIKSLKDLLISYTKNIFELVICKRHRGKMQGVETEG